MGLSELERAYLSGFFDGEGSIYATRRGDSWALGVAMCNSDRGMLNRFKRAFGGSIYAQSKSSGDAKDMWKWAITGVGAVAACEALAPYLRGKRRQAICGVRWRDALNLRADRPRVQRQRARLGRRIEQLNGSRWLAKRRARGVT